MNKTSLTPICKSCHGFCQCDTFICEGCHEATKKYNKELEGRVKQLEKENLTHLQAAFDELFNEPEQKEPPKPSLDEEFQKFFGTDTEETKDQRIASLNRMHREQAQTINLQSIRISKLEEQIRTLCQEGENMQKSHATYVQNNVRIIHTLQNEVSHLRDIAYANPIQPS